VTLSDATRRAQLKVRAYLTRSGNAPWKQKPADGDVLVELWPMDPDAAANEPPVGKVPRCRIAKPGKPFEWYVNAPSVLEVHDQLALDEADAQGSRVLRGRNAHATSQGTPVGAESSIS